MYLKCTKHVSKCHYQGRIVLSSTAFDSQYWPDTYKKPASFCGNVWLSFCAWQAFGSCSHTCLPKTRFSFW